MTPAQLGRAYDTPPVIDYGPHRGPGLLLATGAGLMLAVMDQLTTCRWAVDLGGGRGHRADLGSWAEAVDDVVPLVVAATWFTVTDPDQFTTRVLSRFAETKVITYARPALTYGTPVPELDELLPAAAGVLAGMVIAA